MLYTYLALLCAGVTTYKAIKESEAIPGQFLCVVGAAGGLGHLAIQFGKAMGLRVIALDVGENKLEFCRSLGAEYTIDAQDAEAWKIVKSYTNGGAHAVVCVAPHAVAYTNTVYMCRPKGTIVCVGLPAGNIQIPISELVMNRITLRGSIVGNRQDMKEVMDFANRGLVKCSICVAPLESVNEVVEEMKMNKYEGRVVFEM